MYDQFGLLGRGSHGPGEPWWAASGGDADGPGRPLAIWNRLRTESVGRVLYGRGDDADDRGG
eukprot:7594750-Heterocapsa_arctica.AAC.1